MGCSGGGPEPDANSIGNLGDEDLWGVASGAVCAKRNHLARFDCLTGARNAFVAVIIGVVVGDADDARADFVEIIEYGVRGGNDLAEAAKLARRQVVGL